MQASCGKLVGGFNMPIIFLFFLSSFVFGGENCLPTNSYTKYVLIQFEKPSEICSLKPQPYKMKIKNLNSYGIKVSTMGIEFLEEKYPVSSEADFKVNYTNFITLPKSFGYPFPPVRRVCGFSNIIFKPYEEKTLTCYYVNLECNYLKEYGSIRGFVEIISPIYSVEEIKESYFIENKDKSCFKKTIEPKYYFWEPEEEGEVLLKIKNKCDYPIIEGFENSLYMKFGSNFKPIAVLETNGKNWEILNNNEFAIYFEKIMPGEEVYANIKVKAHENIPSSDYAGEAMILSLINEKEPDTNMYFEESASTIVFVCMYYKE
jgi:hypothetical protein